MPETFRFFYVTIRFNTIQINVSQTNKNDDTKHAEISDREIPAPVFIVFISYLRACSPVDTNEAEPVRSHDDTGIIHNK